MKHFFIQQSEIILHVIIVSIILFLFFGERIGNTESKESQGLFRELSEQTVPGTVLETDRKDLEVLSKVAKAPGPELKSVENGSLFVNHNYELWECITATDMEEQKELEIQVISILNVLDGTECRDLVLEHNTQTLYFGVPGVYRIVASTIDHNNRMAKAAFDFTVKRG